MPRYEFQVEARPSLITELMDAGFAPETPVEPGNGKVWVTVAEEDYDRAAAVVNAHDAAGYDAAEAAERTQFQQDVANLKLYQGIASPTLAQTAAATKAQNRILRRVVTELREG